MSSEQSAQKSNSFVPSNYGELYTHYIKDGSSPTLVGSLIRKFVRYASDDEEDSLRQEVAERAIKKDVINLFDPSKSNFGGVMFFVTRSVCVNHLSKKSRSPIGELSVGSIVESDSMEDPGEIELGVWRADDIIEPVLDREYDKTEAKILISRLWEIVKEKHSKPITKRDESLKPLMLMMMEQYEVKDCAGKLGVTSSTIHNWISYLRDVLRDEVMKGQREG